MTDEQRLTRSSQSLDSAITYFFPLFEMARTRYLMSELVLNPARRTPNELFHQQALADHRARTVTTPNTDTLYSSSWLDLKASPLLLIIPPIAKRYWSVALMDQFTNNYAMLGSRTRDGVHGASTEALLIGPQEDLSQLPLLYERAFANKMPENLRIIVAPSNDVWLLARWLVDSQADIPAAHHIQAQTKLSALRPNARVFSQAVRPDKDPSPETFLAVVNEMLSRGPLPVSERAMAQAWTSFGFTGKPEAWSDLSAETKQLWASLLDLTRVKFSKGLTASNRVFGPWS